MSKFSKRYFEPTQNLLIKIGLVILAIGTVLVILNYPAYEEHVDFSRESTFRRELKDLCVIISLQSDTRVHELNGFSLLSAPFLTWLKKNEGDLELDIFRTIEITDFGIIGPWKEVLNLDVSSKNSVEDVIIYIWSNGPNKVNEKGKGDDVLMSFVIQN